MRWHVNHLSLFLVVVFVAACSFKNDGSLWVLEGDCDKNCSELHIEWEKADELSRENVEARKRWILQLLRILSLSALCILLVMNESDTIMPRIEPSLLFEITASINIEYIFNAFVSLK